MNRSIHRMQKLAVAIPLLFALGTSAAIRFDPARQPLGEISRLELSDLDLANGAKVYRGWFENGAWQGDLVEYNVDSSGNLTTTVDLSGTSPVNTGDMSNWSAHANFAAVADNYWDATRKIITNNGTGQTAFRWPNLSDAQKQALDVTAYTDNAGSSVILDYIRGDRSNETPAGSLRARVSILGDIIHSNPVYVSIPNESRIDSGYAAFADANKSRDDRVYVGANDGMLHVFDADDGTEVYAYVPSMVMGELDKLAGRPYEHLYSVDGRIEVRDADAGGWKTVLVGGLGAGGKGYYALDITDPDLDAETKTTGDNKKLLWELTTSDPTAGNDVGYGFGAPVIAKLNDDNWYAVVGNGYNSVNGIAKLLIIDLASGEVKKVLSTDSGSPGSPNGLSAPALTDLDRNGTADVAYAGDIDGNLWKFDLTSINRSGWEVAYNKKPLHPGISSQPIIQAPDLTLHPKRGLLVYFGTGRLFELLDITDLSTQAIYGIWDLRGSSPPSSDNQALHVQTLSGDLGFTTAGGISETVQTFTPEPDPSEIDWDTMDGWKVELPAGYRVLSPVTVRAGRIKTIIHNPDIDENYIVEPDYVDGGAPDSAIFDLDQNGNLGLSDNVDGNGNGQYTDSDDVVAMWKLPDGLMSEVTIGRISKGVDTQFFNYLVPPQDDPCTGNCTSGFQGGHIDVDTDYWNDGDGSGGGTYEHTHEYDKKTGRVYVDYSDHGAETGHVFINNSGFIPQDAEFIVLVANADLSPGSVLTIGDREYNAVEYQTMIHKKLWSWGGGTANLQDDQGKSLIFKMSELTAAGATVRHDFNDMAILAGGVHPTNTGCVNGSDSVTKGRYRNGSLVTQFINLSRFPACVGDGCALERIIVQEPTDLPTEVLLSDSTRIPMGEDLNKDGVISKADFEVFGGLRGINTNGDGGDGGKKKKGDKEDPPPDDGGGDPVDTTGEATELLFESTIFWHYPGGACYGDSDWESDVADAIDNLTFTQEEFDTVLNSVGIDNLAQEVSETQACIDADGSDAQQCRDYMADVLMDLLDMQGQVFDPDGGQLGDGSGLDGGDGSPFSMEGEASTTGRNDGSNEQVGRRTWTDIFNE